MNPVQQAVQGQAPQAPQGGKHPSIQQFEAVLQLLAANGLPANPASKQIQRLALQLLGLLNAAPQAQPQGAPQAPQMPPQGPQTPPQM